MFHWGLQMKSNHFYFEIIALLGLNMVNPGKKGQKSTSTSTDIAANRAAIAAKIAKYDYRMI